MTAMRHGNTVMLAMSSRSAAYLVRLLEDTESRFKDVEEIRTMFLNQLLSQMDEWELRPRKEEEE